MTNLVLSLFPGIGLLDRAFEETGYCVVRGPDVLWGGDIRSFHVPAGHFSGVIGGPPCQSFSALIHIIRANGDEPSFGNLIPEFERVVAEAQPHWFVMENVPGAPVPVVDGYIVLDQMLNNRWFGAEQNRVRRFSFGTRDGLTLQFDGMSIFESPTWSATVTGDMRVNTNGARIRKKGKGGVSANMGQYAPFAHMLRLQGLPEDFLSDSPFTSAGKRKAVGNGVPLPLGKAIATAVARHFPPS